METPSVSNNNHRSEWTNAPPVVRWTMVFFGIMTWLAFAGCTFGAFATARNNYWFCIPAIGYVVLLTFFSNLDYKPGKGLIFNKQRRGRSWAGTNYSNYRKRAKVFLGISFVLIVSLNFCNFNYFTMYFVLMGHTLGMLEWPANIPMVVLECITFFAQILLLSNNLSLDSLSLLQIVISAFIGLSYAAVIVMLVRSRLKSEMLVQELQATKQRLEEALSKEQTVAILQERNRMAREMHDILGHALVLVAVKLEAAQRLQKIDPKQADTEIEATKQLVRQSMSELRSSLADLRSPMPQVGNKSLIENFQDWAVQTAKEGCFELFINFEAQTENLPIVPQEILWQVGREALLNVVKHAWAKKVEVVVICQDNNLILKITDDGVGIPHLNEGKIRLEIEGHYGMRGMRERLETVGGHLQVASNNGQGTQVIATLPLPVCEETMKPEAKSSKFLAFHRA